MIYLFLMLVAAGVVLMIQSTLREGDSSQTYGCIVTLLMLPIIGLVGLFFWMVLVVVLE